MLDLARFTHLTFDCYGTLIDWEVGILEAVMPVLRSHGVAADETHILRSYARHEAAEEAGSYRDYRAVLRGVVERFAEEHGFVATDSDREALAASVGTWRPFPDTVDALRRLGTRYRLVILSNVDDDIFQETARLLRVPFEDVVTAQQVGSYKPALENFRFALRRLGVPVGGILHVAQSLYHDHAPAKRLGLATARVNRASRNPGTGVALPAEATPDLEVPDLESLASLAGV